LIKTVVKVILIIAVVGVGVYAVLAERAERAETERVISGTATYSGTWSANPAPKVPVPFGGERPMWPDLSGTCKLTVDFDAYTASISFAGDRSGTISMRCPGHIGHRFSGGKMINDWRWLVSCDISKEDPDKVVGRWSCIYEPHGVRSAVVLGTWKAQKVPTP